MVLEKRGKVLKIHKNGNRIESIAVLSYDRTEPVEISRYNFTTFSRVNRRDKRHTEAQLIRWLIDFDDFSSFLQNHQYFYSRPVEFLLIKTR